MKRDVLKQNVSASQEEEDDLDYVSEIEAMKEITAITAMIYNCKVTFR